MRYLRTNTDTRITVGPFLDKVDGITPEVALTVTNCKLTLVVDTAGVPTLILDTAPTASGGANDMVHVTGDDAGFYDLELAAANVNYLGRAMLALTDAANHCPVFHEFMILPANVYDSLVLGTDLLDTSTAQVAGQTASASAGVTFPTSIGTGTSTLTQAQVTGGAYDLTNAAVLVNANLKNILGTLLTETVAGYLTAAFKKFYNIATPLLTVEATIQSAAEAALSTYDPPTNTEMEARTLTASGYATPTNITAATGCVLGNSASHGGAAAVITLGTPIVANATQIEGTDATTQLESAVDAALDNAMPAVPTAGSINDVVKDLDAIIETV